ncbi:MAG TPA: phosphatase PAP2 family protein [Caulobacteraceae bacterium]|nr:phosphatase PAP2 family protein [Caulobacteraceae bacterium]
MHRRLLLAVVLVLAAAGSCPAWSAQKAFEILTPEQIDPSRLLPPPAPDGSERQKADLAEVERVYRGRSPERRAQAEWDDKHESVELFFSTLGPAFDLNKLPATARLLAIEDNDQGLVATAAKRYFLRKRPWAIDPSLVACDYAPNAPPLTSYPSGHATLSYSMGYVLAALMPEKAQAILARAQDYAYSRVVCGAHYPSDIEASHVLGTELAMMLMENPKFQQEFELARAELKAAGLTAR